MVDDHVSDPPPIKNALKRMLDPDPDTRPPRGAALLSVLEVTRRHEELPQHFLILTQRALHDLRAAGHSVGDSFPDAAAAVVEDLGGKEVDEVHVNREQQDDRGLILLGDSLRLVCTRHQQDDALVVKAIQTPYGPHLDLEKGRSMLYRAMWMPVDSPRTVAPVRDATARALRQLWRTLRDHESANVGSKERRRSRQEFIEHWNVALRNARSRIDKETPALKYVGSGRRARLFHVLSR